MVSRHVAEREIVIKAWRQVFGREPTNFEARMVHAVAELETNFGRGWKGAGVGSNNLGAVQAPGCPAGESFAYTDTHPNDDGTSTRYQICFRTYPTLQAGAEHLIKIMLRGSMPVAMRRRSELAVSAAMYLNGYYEGFGADEDDRIVNHYIALIKADARIAAALGEAPPKAAKIILPEQAMRPTLRFGSTGEAVREWQRILNLAGHEIAADGVYGPITAAATADWQAAHGLEDDGIVGPKTWGAALAEAADA